MDLTVTPTQRELAEVIEFFGDSAGWEINSAFALSHAKSLYLWRAVTFNPEGSLEDWQSFCNQLPTVELYNKVMAEVSK